MNERRQFIGKWITAPEFAKLEPLNMFHRQLEPVEILSKAPENAHLLFRRKFEMKKTGKCRIFISADDYYKLYVNGRFVCQGPAPGYYFHYYYNEVDVTDYLHDGENLIAVHSYYQGLINRVWMSGDDRHGLILDLVQDGKTLISSDSSFLYSYHSGYEQLGTTGYKTQFLEKYISGNAHEDFYLTDYDDDGWNKAFYRENIDYELYPQESKMLEFEKIFPASVKRQGQKLIVDFGAMYVGYLEAVAKGEKGSECDIYFAQELEDDGNPRWKLRCNCEYHEKWVFSGKTDKLWEFDYKAFRYVMLELPEGAELSEIFLVARHYPFELKARPNTDDKELISIWELCVRSLKYGVQEVIQDCMEREKGNYLGDGCYTALTYTVLTHDPSMLKKLIDDSMRSCVVNKGLMTCAACSFMQEIAEYPLMMYYTLLMYYRFSGDIAYIEKHYSQLREILDFYKESYALESGLLCNLDKWCVAEWPMPYRDGYDVDITEGRVCTALHNVINAHYIGAVKCMNELCAIIGKEPYMDEKPLIDAFDREFYMPDKKLYRDGAETNHVSLLSNIFPLMYDFCPSKESEEAILSLMEERGLTAVMLFGAYPFLWSLKRLGKTEDMHRHMKDKKAWLNMLSEGATSTFEGWGKDAKWNTSLFHLTLSYGALFLTDWENYN